jgi:hypothetical protein
MLSSYDSTALSAGETPPRFAPTAMPRPSTSAWAANSTSARSWSAAASISESLVLQFQTKMEPIDLSTVRRWQRTVRSLPIKLLVESQGQKTEYSAYTLDISNEGARVRTDVELKAGQTVGVLPREECRTVLRSRVVWVGGPGSKHEGEAGLEFLPDISTD